MHLFISFEMEWLMYLSFEDKRSNMSPTLSICPDQRSEKMNKSINPLCCYRQQVVTALFIVPPLIVLTIDPCGVFDVLIWSSYSRVGLEWRNKQPIGFEEDLCFHQRLKCNKYKWSNHIKYLVWCYFFFFYFKICNGKRNPTTCIVLFYKGSNIYYIRKKNMTNNSLCRYTTQQNMIVSMILIHCINSKWNIMLLWMNLMNE